MRSPLIVTGHPGLIKPPWEPPHMIQRVGIRGIVKAVELIDARTGLIKRRLEEFENLITNAGLNGIGNGTRIDALAKYIAVGTDNTAPDPTDTGLGSQLGDRYDADGGFADAAAAGPAYAYWSFVRTREIPADDCNGNLTELGLFSAAEGGTLWMRQLFLSGGSPTVLTKTDNEILRIIYEWRVYLVLSPTTDELTINTVEIDCESRALQGNDDDAWGTQGVVQRLGAWTTDNRRASAYETNSFPAIDGGTFSGGGSIATTINTIAYGGDNFYLDQDLIWDPGAANFDTGIGAVALPRIGDYIGSAQFCGTTFTPKVAKSDLQRFTFRARVSFTRV